MPLSPRPTLGAPRMPCCNTTPVHLNLGDHEVFHASFPPRNAGLARHHHFDGPQGRQGRHRWRWPGLDRTDGHQVQRQEGTQARQGRCHRRLCRGDCRRFYVVERLESKLEQYPGQLTRAAVELAKDWRTDRYLRRLEAMMIVADKDVSLVLTGTGDVLEPEGGVMAIGSGGNYALAAARALAETDKDAEAIVRRALDIAADICVYTNRNVTIEMLQAA